MYYNRITRVPRCYRERAAISSALHASRSSSYPGSQPRSSPSPSKSFTRSHRVQDIVSMCSEERCSFSGDDHGATALAVGSNDDADNARGTVGPDAWPDLSAAIMTTFGPGFDRASRCWSCDDRDDDDDDDGTTAAMNGRRRRLLRSSRPATEKPDLLIRITRFR